MKAVYVEFGCGAAMFRDTGVDRSKSPLEVSDNFAGGVAGYMTSPIAHSF
ncbi:MAG: hypothetical protein IPN95_19600 [Bacteroidetes bacterium]|nr:hypothetical protein [Bacteroidota bacterium]